MTQHFDSQSGVRERLALLAQLGPTMTANDWGYNPSHDFWYACGTQTRVAYLRIRQEGSASLDIIKAKWGMERASALAFIGYPESK
jgi:hypothetical protein